MSETQRTRGEPLGPESPWPGLASFTEADRDFFFGRGEELETLHRLVVAGRLTVLLGLSGLGKTSLLQAGLFPLLRSEGFLPVAIRFDWKGDDARQDDQFQRAVLREAESNGVEAPRVEAGDGVWEWLHRQGATFWSPRNKPLTPVFVFDQFEELFTLGAADAARLERRDRQIEDLGDLAEGRVPARLRERLDRGTADPSGYTFTRHAYRIVLALREDFLGELESLRERIPSLAEARLRLRKLTGDRAADAVARAGSQVLAPGVSEQIVRFVAGDETGRLALSRLETEPSLLSLFCRELNERRRAQGQERITASLIAGSRASILQDFYDQATAASSAAGLRFVEEHLLTVAGYRDSVALENALALGVARVEIEELVRRRLLRLDERAGGVRVELTHDVLCGVVRSSRERARRSRAVRQAWWVALAAVAFAAFVGGWTVYEEQLTEPERRRLRQVQDEASDLKEMAVRLIRDRQQPAIEEEIRHWAAPGAPADAASEDRLRRRILGLLTVDGNALKRLADPEDVDKRLQYAAKYLVDMAVAQRRRGAGPGARGATVPPGAALLRPRPPAVRDEQLTELIPPSPELQGFKEQLTRWATAFGVRSTLEFRGRPHEWAVSLRTQFAEGPGRSLAIWFSVRFEGSDRQLAEMFRAGARLERYVRWAHRGPQATGVIYFMPTPAPRVWEFPELCGDLSQRSRLREALRRPCGEADRLHRHVFKEMSFDETASLEESDRHRRRSLYQALWEPPPS